MKQWELKLIFRACLLYTSDAADDGESVDLGGRRIIKKNMEIGPKSCVPRIRTGIYFSVFVFGLRHLELF